MDLSEALSVIGASPHDSMAEVRKRYRALAKRCHPDSARRERAGELAVDFAQLSQAYKAIEKHHQEGGGSCSVDSKLGSMPISVRDRREVSPRSDRKVLRFVSGDGTVVRQEIQVRQEKNGKKEILAVNLPDSPPPPPDEEEQEEEEQQELFEAADEESSPPGTERGGWWRRGAAAEDAAILPGAPIENQFYLHRSPSREATMPVFHGTHSRIPF